MLSAFYAADLRDLFVPTVESFHGPKAVVSALRNTWFGPDKEFRNLTPAQVDDVHALYKILSEYDDLQLEANLLGHIPVMNAKSRFYAVHNAREKLIFCDVPDLAKVLKIPEVHRVTPSITK